MIQYNKNLLLNEQYNAIFRSLKKDLDEWLKEYTNSLR